MINRPKAFLSYSHADRDTAERIAEALRASGVDVWWDNWEILPGDSLIQKVFEEGLSRADAFIVLISPNSVNSNWVRHELDTALIRRMEGVTRVIPLIIQNTPVPTPLKPLKWINLTDDFDSSLRELQAAIYGIRERPPIGQPPEFVKNSSRSIGGLSPLATSIGLFLASTGKYDIGSDESFSASDLADSFGLSSEETDDAINELERLGLVKTTNYLGTHPFEHGDVEPTYALFLHFKGEGLDYDPESDIKAVASAVEAHKQIDGPHLQEIVQIPPLRLNRAVAYLKDYGFVNSISYFGTAPFDFGTLQSISATRQFVAENCK